MKKTYHNALSYGSLENGISVHTTLWNLALWILNVFVQILLNVNLESNSPEILTLCETNLDDSIDSKNFSLKFSFNLKGFCYSYAWSRSLCEGRTSFCTRPISRKLCRFWLVLSTEFTSLNALLLFPVSINFFIFMHSLPLETLTSKIRNG